VETRPFAPKIWEQLPPEVQAYILVLENSLRQSLEKLPNWRRESMNWKPGLIAIPTISLSLLRKTRLELPRESSARKVGGLLVVSLAKRGTIENLPPQKIWIIYWYIYIRMKPVHTAIVFCKRGWESKLPPWKGIRYGSCPNIILLLPNTDWWQAGALNVSKG
jgi:hypothetical protein